MGGEVLIVGVTFVMDAALIFFGIRPGSPRILLMGIVIGL